MTKVFTAIMLKGNKRFHNHQEKPSYPSILQNTDEIKIHPLCLEALWYLAVPYVLEACNDLALVQCHCFCLVLEKWGVTMGLNRAMLPRKHQD